MSGFETPVRVQMSTQLPCGRSSDSSGWGGCGWLLVDCTYSPLPIFSEMVKKKSPRGRTLGGRRRAETC